MTARAALLDKVWADYWHDIWTAIDADSVVMVEEANENHRSIIEAAIRAEGLDVERLAIALNNGSRDGLDDKDEWYTSPRALAEDVAAEYARLANEAER